MKLLRKSLWVCGSVFLGTSIASAAVWEIDGAHSNAGFKIKHLVISTVSGSINPISGTVEIDDQDITKSKINATIPVENINTGDKKRDDHLRNPDFFDVKKFPKMEFTSTKIEKGMGEHALKVHGDLKMHGVTKPVVLDVTAPPTEVKDPWGNIKRAATATVTLSRKDFDLTWNKTLDGGGVVIGEDVEVTIELELNKKITEPVSTKTPPTKKK